MIIASDLTTDIKKINNKIYYQLLNLWYAIRAKEYFLNVHTKLFLGARKLH